MIRNVDFTSLLDGRTIISLEGNMENNETVVLCPNCRWSARGEDERLLNEAKDHHAMYECPLPSSASPLEVTALAS